MGVSEGATEDLRRRVLVIAAGPMRQALTEQLRGEGFLVRDSDDALNVVEMVRSWRPDLVLVEELLPQRSGRQVVLSLRASGESFKVAIAGVLTDL